MPQLPWNNCNLDGSAGGGRRGSQCHVESPRSELTRTNSAKRLFVPPPDFHIISVGRFNLRDQLFDPWDTFQSLSSPLLVLCGCSSVQMTSSDCSAAAGDDYVLIAPSKRCSNSSVSTLHNGQHQWQSADPHQWPCLCPCWCILCQCYYSW